MRPLTSRRAMRSATLAVAAVTMTLALAPVATRPAALAAQSSSLPFDPSAARPIAAGQMRSGEFTTATPRWTDSTPHHMYRYHGRAGEHITVIMRSSAFDSWLAIHPIIGNSLGGTLLYVDDGAGGNDALLDITLPRDGDYAIRANSVTKNSYGPYTIELQSGGAATQASAASASASTASQSIAGARPLAAGQRLSGEFTSASTKWTDGTPRDFYRYRGRAGERLTVIMRATSFDSWLAIHPVENGALGATLKYVDDGAGGNDALLDFTLPADGDYILRANSVSANSYGPYTIELQSSGSTAAPAEAPVSSASGATNTEGRLAGTIRAGQELNGALDTSDPMASDNSYYDLWLYMGKRGEKLAITMRSADFDTYLVFGRLDGNKFIPLQSVDDGADGTNSRMEVTVPDDGIYAIRANTLAARRTGRYTLSVLMLQ